MTTELLTPAVAPLHLTMDVVEFRPTTAGYQSEQQEEALIDCGVCCCCSCCCGVEDQADTDVAA